MGQEGTATRKWQDASAENGQHQYQRLLGRQLWIRHLMAALKDLSVFRLYSDPVLREKALPVQEITDVERKLAEDMLAHDVRFTIGVGLAAPQVGVLKRLIVIDLDRDDPEGATLVLV